MTKNTKPTNASGANPTKTTSTTPSPASPGNVKKSDARDDLSIRRSLLLRLGLAALVIVVLMGGLALYDRFFADRKGIVVETPVLPSPVPEVSLVQAPAEVAPPEPQAEEPQPVAEAVKEAKVEPELTKSPLGQLPRPATAPPPPVISARPRLPHDTAAGTQRPSRPSPGSPRETALASPRVSARAQEPAVQAPPRLFSGFALQAGVFANPRRAEELQAKLAEAGVPVVIESRVQVGPFKNRAEAEAARIKLQRLGIDTYILPPREEARRDR